MSIKKEAKDSLKEVELNEQEYTILSAIQNLRNVTSSLHSEQGRIAGMYLNILARDKHNYTKDDDLEFEIDFEKNDKILKIKKIPKK